MNARDKQEFAKWFGHATGHAPYPFQTRFACDPDLLQLVDVPTGLGKTAMVVLGWRYWQRLHFDRSHKKA
jgi:CRISPR-associated endonuclease/helicase Cas3